MSSATVTPPSPTGTKPHLPVAEIRPQPGKQERFLSSNADICFYGGAAGGGKTWGLLLEPLYHHKVPDFGAVIFRRTYPEIINKGGMWDESMKLYPAIGWTPNIGHCEWQYKLNAYQSTTIKFAHCQYDKNVENWKGAQIPFIGFDQVETFSHYIFWYLFSRNRSLCGVTPYLRATCNPVPSDDPVGGWVHQMIAWWLDCDCTYCAGLPPGESGYLTGNGTAREDRAGVKRWFIRQGDVLIWGNSREALLAKYPDTFCLLTEVQCAASRPDKMACQKDHAKSFTFISSKLQDNIKLMQADPGYLGRLKALPLVEQERLLGGNWKIRPEAGNVFNRAWFKIVEALPEGLSYVRYWDKAGTAEEDNPAAAFSAGVKMGRHPVTGLFYVAHVVRGQWNAGQRERVIQNTAKLDGPACTQWVEQEPGSGGKESAQSTVLNLAGFAVHVDKVTGDKLTRANPYAAQCFAGNVSVLLEEWTQAYIDELHNFDPLKKGYKDQVDASSGAFNKLALTGGPILFTSGGAVTVDGQTAVERAIQQRGAYFPGDR